MSTTSSATCSATSSTTVGTGSVFPSPPQAPDEPTLAVLADGSREWRLPNGDRHRIGGPALEAADGSLFWFEHGLSHRTGGPAAIYGTLHKKEWWHEGQLHRLDGPAIIYPTGKPSWYVHGKRIADRNETAVLNDLHTAGDPRTITQLLTLWQPGGPTMADLLAALHHAAA